MPGLNYCDALATLGATCVQHCTATTSCHTGAETMSALATNDGRLVSTFHFNLANQQLFNRNITRGQCAIDNKLAHADAVRTDANPGHDMNSNICGGVNIRLNRIFSLPVNHLA